VQRRRTRVGVSLMAAVVAVGLIAVVNARMPPGTAIQPSVATTGAEPWTRQAAAAPEEALAHFAATRGSPIAGPCDATQSPRDLGHLCHRLVAEREQDGMQAYLIGLTFSEFTTWVFVARSDGHWAVVADALLDFTSTPLRIPWPP
jgi:hypothetical protein